MIKIILIFSILLLSNLDTFLKFIGSRIKISKRLKYNVVDENFIQKLNSGILNGLIPRKVLEQLAKEYKFSNLEKAVQKGENIQKSIQFDTNNDLTSKSFAQIWQTCETNGASLSPVLTKFNEQLQVEKELRQELESSLSGAKLSAIVLAFLPIIGVLLANFLGANSFNWILNSSVGKICLILGIFLEILGIFWVKKIINNIEKYL